MIAVGENPAKLYHGDQHPAEVYGTYGIPVTGKNMLNIQSFPKNDTISGITCEVSPIGKVRLWGTVPAGQRATFYFGDSILNQIPSKVVTISGYPKGASFKKVFLEVIIKNKSTGKIAYTASKYETPQIILNLVENDLTSLYFTIFPSAGTIDITFEPQIELGEVATAWEPPTGGKPGIFKETVKYAGFETPTLQGLGRVDWNAPYKAAIPMAKVMGKGEQASYAEIPAQTAPIVTMNTDVERPLHTISQIVPIQEGTGDPSPTNVRNIKGWSGAKLNRCGKNLLPVVTNGSHAGITVKYENDTYILDGTATGWFYLRSSVQLPAGSYTVSSESQSNSNVGVRVLVDGVTHPKKVVTLTKNSTISVDLTINLNQTVTNERVKVQLQTGDQATQIEPYSGTEYTIQFGEDVYGGTFDWQSGELTVKWEVRRIDDKSKVKVLPDNCNADSNLFYATVKAYKEDFNYIEIGKLSRGNIFNWDNIVSASHTNTGFTLNAASPTLVYMRVRKDTGIADLSAFENYIRTTPVEVTVPVNERVIKLTPTQINSLIGVNNIYSDTGDTTASAYAGPSPEYPIQPQFIEGAKVECKGKNLISEMLSGAWSNRTGDFIPNAKDYVASPKIPLFDQTNVVVTTVPHKNAEYAHYWSADNTWLGKYSERADPPKGARFVAYNWFVRGQVFDSVQIEYGTVATPYEPYYDGGSVNLPILRALPDGSVKDEYDVRTGKLTRRLGHKQFDKFDKWHMERYSAGLRNFYTEQQFFDAKTYSYGVCNISGLGKSLASYGAMISSSYRLNIIPTTQPETVEEWTAYVAQLKEKGTPLEIVYQLQDPIIEQYDPTIIRQHPGYTQLIQQGGFAPTEIDATVYQEDNNV